MGLTPYLAVEDLHVRYDRHDALAGVDVAVDRSEVVAVLGPNGAGKTTLLRAIAGAVGAWRGEVRVEGLPVTRTHPARRAADGVVFVPSGRAVFAGLSVRDNLLTGCHLFAWDRGRVEAQVGRVTALFPRLGERMDQIAGSLSGGEQQMLALAKGLVLEPRLLLIDELTLGLAPAIVRQLTAAIAGLRADGTTMVVVAQSASSAGAVADRVLELRRGRVVFDGRVRDFRPSVP